MSSIATLCCFLRWLVLTDVNVSLPFNLVPVTSSSYQRLPDSDHMWRDVKEFHQVRRQSEIVREVIAVDNDKYLGELTVDWEKKNAGKKGGGKKKKK